MAIPAGAPPNETTRIEHNSANLALTTIPSAITASQTTITVASGTSFPSPVCYATICPPNGAADITNSEIVAITAISGNTFTISRGTNGTTAKAFPAGSIILNGVYIYDKPYDASVLMNGNATYFDDFDGLCAAIRAGRPIVAYYSEGSLSDGAGSYVQVLNASIVNMMSIGQPIQLQYMIGDRIVYASIDPETHVITRSGVNIATSGNKIITGSMIRNNTITSDNVDFTTLSTTEKRIGTWTNNKPIYQRVIITTAGSFASVVNAIGIDELLRIGGYFITNNGSRMLLNSAFTFGESNKYDAALFRNSSGKYEFQYFSEFSSAGNTVKAILDYTKS